MYATQRTIDKRRLVVSVPGKRRAAFLQFAVVVFKAFDKLLERLSERFGNENLSDTIDSLQR